MTYDLETIRTAVAKATAGKWKHYADTYETKDFDGRITGESVQGWNVITDTGTEGSEVIGCEGLLGDKEADAEAIVALMNAARNGLLEDAAIGRDAAAEITRLRARVAELEAALKQAGQWFHEYGVSHHAKGATEKAERNIERSQFCLNAALKGAADD